MTTVKPPTAPVLALLGHIEDGLSRIIAARAKLAPLLGQFESDVEASLLLALAIRQMEGLTELARRDLVLVPPAAAVARAVLETSARILWLMAPSRPYEREGRWLAHVRAEEEWWDKVAGVLDHIGGDGSQTRAAAAQMRSFRTAVQNKVPSQIAIPSKVPNLRQMLAAVGNESKYVYYMDLSQYAHGSHKATNLYRHNLGIHKQLGEFVDLQHWYIIFAASWPALCAAANAFVQRTTRGGGVLDDEFLAAMADAIGALQECLPDEEAGNSA